jgi:hypothetical protein
MHRMLRALAAILASAATLALAPALAPAAGSESGASVQSASLLEPVALFAKEDDGGSRAEDGSGSEDGSDDADGPEVATKEPVVVDDHSATLRALLRSEERTTYRFEYGLSSAYGSSTAAASLPGATEWQQATASIAGLAPSTTYHYRIVAESESGTTAGPDQIFATPATLPSTSPDTGETVPSLGETVVLGPAAGTVLVKVKGESRFKALTGLGRVPVGSTIDTRRGTVRLVSALDRAGRTQAASFHGGKFQVRQARSGGGMTDIVLRGGSFQACGRPHARRASAAASRRRVRRLWSDDHHGRFRTRGHNSVATVRGTSWLTVERCDGTLTRVSHGTVVVRDRHTGRRHVLRRGEAYLARARR